LNSVDSTNNYALALIKEKELADGTLIWAHNQLNGRGQRDAKWFAKEGTSLTASFVLHPSLTIEDLYYLTKMTVLAVADMVNGLLADKSFRVDIKWPNDVMLGHKKMGGILIENVLRGSLIKTSVIGIGLNIFNQVFPDEAGLAGCIEAFTPIDCSLRDCMVTLCECLEVRYLQLKAKRYEDLDRHYFGQLYAYHQWAQYQTDEKIVGFSEGVTKEGKLILKHDTGERHLYEVKEIKLLNLL